MYKSFHHKVCILTLLLKLKKSYFFLVPDFSIILEHTTVPFGAIIDL